ncbi:hypothetical protein GGS23DRAFT_523242 [Durotheca rogersii]|uniref:uncharacterized protein n=1 Tax=Durotheca rogersii TaxID=419775 RepID=UPI002220F495|nr:uncharacterized protein GGS23DRAFT_523242 [Durotheca rogersii]KAI5863975.1 hypothetical protein GGS23DRAFT_523242 [Durotheca rogersii]
MPPKASSGSSTSFGPLTKSIRRLYRLIGFSKTYNLWLWLVLGGGLFTFSAARLPNVHFGNLCGSVREGGVDGVAPGECFYYLQPGRYQIGIVLHLACILPAGLLACLQFVPGLRRRAPRFHRISGYAIAVLSTLGSAGSAMIVRRSMGGTLDTQALLGVLTTAFLVSLYFGYVTGMRMQIDEHRTWMLRAWVYSGSILTLRIVLVFAVISISLTGGYYSALPCGKINFIKKSENATLASYPECAAFFSGEKPELHAVVEATVFNRDAVQMAAAINQSFGMSGWVALALHVVCLEFYLRYTSDEGERLRKMYYPRRVALGLEKPLKASTSDGLVNEKAIANGDSTKKLE